MRKEVSSAVDFITKLLRSSGRVNGDAADTFNVTLTSLLCEKYNNHWFPEKPFKGSGFRCLRINHKMEPLITKAAVASGLTEEQLLLNLPNELTMWIDPHEVSYRIGEDGSVGHVYNAEGEAIKPQQKTSISTPSQSPRFSPTFGSPSGSAGSSPRNTPSPVHYLSHSPSTSRHQNYFQAQSCKGQMNSMTYRQSNNDAMNLQRLAAYVYS
ncbi:protein BTG1-like [Lineus longissimus]|uniref:protein BTG1-like n=1 Tax=Lineus longissimus TaxID=88925 RepID=UPI00315D0B31